VKNFVVDASVGAKWVTPDILEPLADQAYRFLSAHAEGAIQVVVPDLFWLEIGRFLSKAAKRGIIPSAMAQHALEAMLNRDFPTVPSRAFLTEAFKIASAFDRTIDDSTYVAMAAATGRELMTADERLVNAMGSRFPVRWLGAF
jgi:predicted nucleic acid-binding protein